MDDFEARVRARAHRLWLQNGRPRGGAEAYHNEARELEPVESIVPVENDADVPTLTDQGEESTHPHKRRGR